MTRPSASSVSLSSLPTLNMTGYYHLMDMQSKPPPNIVAPASPTTRTYPSPPLNPQIPHQGTPPDTATTPTNTVAIAAGGGSSITTRPLPPRHNPASYFSGSPRSIELVTPFGIPYASTIASFPGSLKDAVRWSNATATAAAAAAASTATVAAKVDHNHGIATAGENVIGGGSGNGRGDHNEDERNHLNGGALVSSKNSLSMNGVRGHSGRWMS